MRILITSILLLGFFICLEAQSYHNALGLRIGTDFGFTYQHRVGASQTMEGILQTGLFDRSGQLAVLFEQHQRFLSRGFNFYYGAGPQVGWLELRDVQETTTVGGFALILGVEMALGKVILSYDIKPNINVFGNASLINFDSAISARAVINKKSKLDKESKRSSSKSKDSKSNNKPSKKKKKTHSM